MTDQLEELELLSMLDDGLITTARLREAGVAAGRTLERLLAAGLLTRIRRGVYVLSSVWATMRPQERYRALVRATALTARHELVVSHLSAAAMHGLPLVRDWPRTVHVLEPFANGGSSAPMLTGHRNVPESETVVIDGVRATVLARTLADIAVLEPLERSLPALDAGLHRARLGAESRAAAGGVPRRGTQMDAIAQRAEDAAREAVLSELDWVAPTRWRRRAETAIAFANGLADGPGESLSRVRFLELGFAIPELQVRFDGADGRDAFVDCFWRGVRKIGEFDGRYKYLRGAILKPGQDPGEVVFQEKRREDALRRQADSVARWVWDDVLPPRTFYRFLVEHDVPRAGRAR